MACDAQEQAQHRGLVQRPGIRCEVVVSSLAKSSFLQQEGRDIHKSVRIQSAHVEGRVVHQDVFRL